ncbi:VIT1/CCC1 transporter family protein [Gammaproteobacteria bacterium]|nr:VIT1/CCC1 transporter family protein [Gammaproteobacteria bacterium]
MEALDNWKEEKRSSYLYLKLSDLESDSAKKQMFVDLSNLAERQALIWEESLKKENIKIPGAYAPDFRVRLVIVLVKTFGIKSLRIALAALKVRGMSVYQAPHVSHPHPMPTSVDDIEQAHRSINKGNNIRAAVFGVNDGLVSNMSLILGVAGASVNNKFILLSGVAGLLAGALSMAAGEYISVRSQREMLEYQLKLEKNELELYPEEEAAELALIYEARGLPKEDAEKIANILIKDPEKALDTLAREELGINPDDMISPWGASISSFVSFAVGAFIPLSPYLFFNSHTNLFFTILLTGIALFSVGSFLSIFTQKNSFFSGLRMLFIGSMAGALTYLIGNLFGLAV